MPYIGKKPADIIATVIDTTTGTFSGEVDAGSLDVSGNADIDGITNLDNTDIDGTLNVQGETTLQTHLNMGDNDIIKLGDSADLQIYHDSINSRIDDAGSGRLIIRGNGGVSLEKYTGETLAIFNADGASSLYYDNSPKLATTSTGIDVTGTAVTDGLTVSGTAAINNIIDMTGSTANYIKAATSGGDLRFITNESGTNKQRVIISNNGDISFYEDTGTTPKLFWDASAESLLLGTSTIRSNFFNTTVSPSFQIEGANVSGGVASRFMSQTFGQAGTNGPIFTFAKHRSNSVGGTTVVQSGDELGQLVFQGSDGTEFVEAASIRSIVNGTPGANDMPGALVFSTTEDGASSATERMRIDSSGNVGIGTTNPATFSLIPANRLVVGTGSSDEGITIYSSTSTAGTLAFADGTSGDAEYRGFVQYHHNGDYMRFYTAATERMRIDSSGNLLVGTSSINPADNNDASGSQLSSIGSIQASVSNATPAIFNRGNDGLIVGLLKAGVIVGSIGTLSSRLHIENGDTGLRIAGDLDQIFPCGSGGSDRDAAIDLGSSGVRFKDLYLSGGVYLGGTGSANYLEDYEEGTWTPSISTGTSYASQIGHYTKIGNVVHIKCNIEVTTLSAVTNELQGLPFSASNTGQSSGAVNVMYYSNINEAVTWLSGYVINATSNIYFTGNTGSAITIGKNAFNIFKASTRILFSCTYRTA